MVALDFCLLLSISISLCENVALCLCIYSSNFCKMGLEIPLGCLTKLIMKHSQESSHHGYLQVRARLCICWISIQSSGFTQVSPHILTHVAACHSAKIMIRRSRAVVSSSALILVQGQAFREPSSSIAGTTLEDSLEMLFPLSTLRAGFNCPPSWQMGVEVVTSGPSWQLPFHKETCIQLEDFN